MIKESYELGVQQAMVDAGLVKESTATLVGVLGGVGTLLEKTSGPKTELARKFLPGAGYGALAGGGIGALTGEDPLTGALMGAGLGAGAGALGKHMFRQSDDVQRLARAAYVAKAGLRDRLKRMPGPETLSKGEMRLDVDSLKRALKGFGY